MRLTQSILNLGCGRRFHPEHTNIDFVSSDSQVKQHDLSIGIPFPDNSFDVVYHSHVLEHFNRSKGELFLRECFRVLKPNGRIRIAVPDLEGIVVEYQKAVAECRNETPYAIERHEWTILELFDQFSRNQSGGEIKNYLSTKPEAVLAFPIKRFGKEASLLTRPTPTLPKTKQQNILRKAYTRLATLFVAQIARLLLGQRGKAGFQIGWFRTSGEIHQHMYDEMFLRRTLLEIGFRSPERVTHLISEIPSWRTFGLDSEPDGSSYKPDSLFMEATKSPIHNS